MKISQLYYTSSKKGLRHKSGFQVYAVSKDLSEEEIREIEPYCVYMQPLDVPSQPSEEEIKELFPVKEVYLRLEKETQVVIKVHYVGKDYTNRYGNYFCHALVIQGQHELLIPELLENYAFKTHLNESEQLEDIPVLATLGKQDVMVQKSRSLLITFIKEHMKACQVLVEKALTALKEGKRIILLCPKEDILSYVTMLHYVLPKSLAEACTFSSYSQQPAQETCLITGILPTGNRFSLSEIQYNTRLILLDFNDVTSLQETKVAKEIQILLELAVKEKYEQYLSWFKQVNSIEEVIWLYHFIEQPTKEPRGGYGHVVDLVDQEKLEVMIEDVIQMSPTIDTPYLKLILEVEEKLQSKRIQEKLVQQYDKWAQCLLKEQSEELFANGLHKMHQIQSMQLSGRPLIEKQNLRIFYVQALERLLAYKGVEALDTFKQDGLELLVSICKNTVPSVWPQDRYDTRQSTLSQVISKQIVSVSKEKRELLLLDLADHEQGKIILQEAMTYIPASIKKELLKWIIQSRIVKLDFLSNDLWRSYYDAIVCGAQKKDLQAWLELSTLMEQGNCEITFKEIVYKQIDEYMRGYLQEWIAVKDYKSLMEDKVVGALIENENIDSGREIKQLRRWILASTKEEKEAILVEERWSQKQLEFIFVAGVAYSQTREALLANYECFKTYTEAEIIPKIIEELVVKQNSETLVIAIRLALVCFSLETDIKWSKELLTQWIINKKQTLVLQEANLLLNEIEQEKVKGLIKTVKQKTTLFGKIISKLGKIRRVK